MSDWEQRRKALLLGADALEGHDAEKWAKFEDAFVQLPRSVAPQDLDYDRINLGERFVTEQNEELEEVFPTPFADLNEALLGGLSRGDLAIIAAPSGVGKSMLLDQILECAYGKGARCRLYLTEMSPQKRRDRWIQRRLGIRMGRIRHRRLKDEEMERVREALDKDFPWDTTKAFGKGFAELAQMIVRHRPDVAAVDVLTKINYDGQRQVSNGVAQLHAAAESVGACLIIAAHLSRSGVDKDTGIRRPPTPDDIKDASSIADFADAVFLLHRKQERDDQGKATAMYEDEARLYVPKARTGEPPQPLKLTFDHDELVFKTPEEQEAMA